MNLLRANLVMKMRKNANMRFSEINVFFLCLQNSSNQLRNVQTPFMSYSEQRELKSDCAFAQSDQSFRCSLTFENK